MLPSRYEPGEGPGGLLEETCLAPEDDPHGKTGRWLQLERDTLQRGAHRLAEVGPGLYLSRKAPLDTMHRLGYSGMSASGLDVAR